MAIHHERIDTTLPIEQAFGFIADFANAERWDPGVASSTRVEADTGEVTEGTRYRLGVRVAGRVATMIYSVTRWDPPNQVTLVGSGSGVAAIDDIRFTATDAGTRIDYTADIRLTGLLRILSPFTGGAIAAIVAKGRDGMQRTLDAMAARQEGPAGAGDRS